jgi:peroxidase
MYEKHRMNFGDSRGDVHPAFTLVATIFIRNHNRLAATLASFHPDWSDEILYQVAIL